MVEILSTWLEGLPLDAALWIIVVIFIILDVLFGTIKAILTKTVSSEKARMGVLHKMGFICAMLLCTFADIAQNAYDFGFSVPVLPMCAVMIVICEVFSLCEHIKQMNPDISLDFLHKKE